MAGLCYKNDLLQRAYLKWTRHGVKHGWLEGFGKRDDWSYLKNRELSNDDDDDVDEGSENVAKKINLPYFKCHRVYFVASPAGLFRGARLSSLATNACSTENNIPFPSLANHIVLSKSWKVDLNLTVIWQLLDLTWNTWRAFWPLINVRFRAAKVRFSQILEYSIHCKTLAKERKEGKR